MTERELRAALGAWLENYDEVAEFDGYKYCTQLDHGHTEFEQRIRVIEAARAALRTIHESDRCDIVRNGDQFLCRYHHRYWQTGICPGLK